MLASDISAMDSEIDSYMRNFLIQDLDFINKHSPEEGNKYTFGTTPFSTFETIVGEIRRPKRFVVFGSGTGAQCFHWNRLFPDIPAIGYEIHDIRYDFSVYIAEKYGIENVELYNVGMEHADIQDGDLIWQNNLCMDQSFCDSINWVLLTRKIEISIVSYFSILEDYQSNGNIILMDNSGNFKGFSCKNLKLPTGWSDDQHFHILEQ